MVTGGGNEDKGEVVCGIEKIANSASWLLSRLSMVVLYVGIMDGGWRIIAWLLVHGW